MMDAVRSYFHTDWAAMTPTDWFGLVVVLTITALMIYVYFWVFRPRNKGSIEAHRDFVLKEHTNDGEDRHGRV